jgi:hypothetical protein
MEQQILNFDNNLKELTADQRDRLFDILKNNIDIFSTLIPNAPFLMLIKSGMIEQAQTMMKNLGK